MSFDQKPSEFYLRAYDLFAILVPGLVFVLIALAVAGNTWIQAATDKVKIVGNSEGWFLGIVLLAGFVSGHIIEGIGSLLDDIEWRLVSTIFSPEGRTSRLVERMRWLKVLHTVVATFVPVLREFSPQRHEICADLCRAFPKRSITLKNARQWALVYLSKHAPGEIKYLIEQKDAQRKAVRNIAVLVLLIFLCPTIGFLGKYSFWLFLLVVATWQRHSQLQWKYSQVVFDHFTAYYAISYAEEVDDGGLHG